MRLISILGASALGLALCGSAFAADTPGAGTQPGTNTQQPVQDGGAAGDVNARDRGGDDTQRERDYQAELKKCDNVADKQKCLDAARKKYNQM